MSDTMISTDTMIQWSSLTVEGKENKADVDVDINYSNIYVDTTQVGD